MAAAFPTPVPWFIGHALTVVYWEGQSKMIAGCVLLQPGKGSTLIKRCVQIQLRMAGIPQVQGITSVMLRVARRSADLSPLLWPLTPFHHNGEKQTVLGLPIPKGTQQTQLHPCCCCVPLHGQKCCRRVPVQSAARNDLHKVYSMGNGIGKVAQETTIRLWLGHEFFC